MLKRLRMADDSPMAIEVCFLREWIGKRIEEHLVDGASLYQLLSGKCGIKLKYAMQAIITRQTFDVDNNVVEFVESRYRSDRYLFRMLLDLKDPESKT